MATGAFDVLHVGVAMLTKMGKVIVDASCLTFCVSSALGAPASGLDAVWDGSLVVPWVFCSV